MSKRGTEDTDKLLATYSFRIPTYTKGLASRLSPYWKNKLYQELLMTVARILHESEFNPGRYLKEEYSFFCLSTFALCEIVNKKNHNHFRPL